MAFVDRLTIVDGLAIPGGAERVCIDIAAGLDPERFESVVCAYAESPPAPGAPLGSGPQELARAGVRLISLGRRGRTDVRAWARMTRMLRSERIDVLHSHRFGPNTYAAVLARVARVPVLVCHEHTWSYEGQPLRRFLDRELIGRSADAFVAVSELDARRMVEVEGVRPGVVMTIPNGVPSRPGGDGDRVRRELGIPADAPVLGALGNARPQKGYPVLVRAAALLRERHPDLRVLIAGHLYDASLTDLVAELGLQDTVLLPGARSDVADVMAAFDIGVNSSDFEGMPLSLMELMDAGRPIVATRVGAVPEIVVDGVTGLLVEPGSSEELARAIGELLGDPARAAEMGRRGRERYHERFEVAAMVDRYERLYVELLERGGGPRP
jgi:glycosyltransferase involved in cell wall biosynthesis